MSILRWNIIAVKDFAANSSSARPGFRKPRRYFEGSEDKGSRKKIELTTKYSAVRQQIQLDARSATRNKDQSSENAT